LPASLFQNWNVNIAGLHCLTNGLFYQLSRAVCGLTNQLPLHVHHRTDSYKVSQSHIKMQPYTTSLRQNTCATTKRVNG